MLPVSAHLALKMINEMSVHFGNVLLHLKRTSTR